MKTDFQKQIYEEVKKLFPAGAVEAFVARPSPSLSGAGLQTVDPSVRLVHSKLDIEIICSDFPSQTENYIAAAIRLRIACDRQSGA